MAGITDNEINFKINNEIKNNFVVMVQIGYKLTIKSKKNQGSLKTHTLSGSLNHLLKLKYQIILIPRLLIKRSMNTNLTIINKPLPTSLFCLNHKIQIRQKLRARTAKKHKRRTYHRHQAQKLDHAKIIILPIAALLRANVWRVKHQQYTRTIHKIRQ